MRRARAGGEVGVLRRRGLPALVTALVIGAGTIGMGAAPAAARLASGQGVAMGANALGQLGDGTTTDRSSAVAIKGLTTAKNAAAGCGHTVSVTKVGTVVAWGDNVGGDLGDGTTVTRLAPVATSGLAGIASVAAGCTHSLAAASDGSVWAWGANGFGQVGDGTVAERHVPISVPNAGPASAVAAGANHSIVLVRDGTVRAWGANDHGQLGNGTTVGSLVPTTVSGLSGVRAVAAACNHNLALLADGTVRAWGANARGQLGNGTTLDSPAPVLVPGLTGVTAIAAGCAFSLAQRADGSVVAWGANDLHQLGDGTTLDRAVPVEVLGLPAVKKVAAGGNNAAAIARDGTVWVWGSNSRGQLGNGSAGPSSQPSNVDPTIIIPIDEAILGDDYIVLLRFDTTVPTVNFSTTPPSVTNQTTAEFGFLGDDADDPSVDLGFECALDSAPLSTCTAHVTFFNVIAGTHFLHVRVTDPAGNHSVLVDFIWRVDTTAPVVTITGHPPASTNSTTASFQFSASDVDDRTDDLALSCSLDGGSFSGCTSPWTYGNVGAGTHTFVARATDEAGNSGSASYSWSVDTSAPSVVITSHPDANTNSTTASFAFTVSDSDDPPGSLAVTCSLDGAPASSCTSPMSYSGLADGNHTLTVTAQDPAGNTAAASFTWRVDTTAPTVTITGHPDDPTNSTSASFDFTASDSDDAASAITTGCSLDGGPFGSCASGVIYASLGDGSHTFSVRGTDAAGNTGPVASFTWTVDTAAPGVVIDTTPSDPTAATSATFTFHGVDPDPSAVLTFTCSIDGGPATSCTSPASYSGLGNGSHTFTVTVHDAAGNTASASFTWTVDTAAPVVTIDSHPTDPTNDTSATFTFHGSDPGNPSGTLTFSCDLDGVTAPCTSPASYTGLSDGSHTFTVTVTDGVGNTGSATFTWTVDTTGPVVTITDHPSDPSNASSASFSFAGSDPGNPTASLLFSCTLDGGLPVMCTSPQVYAGLSDGPHTFTVTVSDGAGNSGSASFTWTVDTAAPTVTIDSGPAATTNSTSATFAFHGDDPGNPLATLTFSCSVDGAPATSCTSPQAYTGVAEGSHIFTVTVTDGASNTGSASYSWTVDTTAPTVAIDSGPAPLTNRTSASFAFHGTDPGHPSAALTYTCSLDGAPAVPCTSPQAYAGVTDGTHTFTVTVTDGAGNSGSASMTWTVDATGPTVTITGHPANPTSDHSATFTFVGSDPPNPASSASFECALDGAAFASCTSPSAYTGLSPSSHSFAVHATDAAGNRSADATFNWTVIATTNVAYLGPFEVEAGTSFSPLVDIFSENQAECTNGRTMALSLDRNPVTGAPGAYFLENVVATADGRGLGAAISTLSPGAWIQATYTVTVSFAGTAGCAPSSSSAPLRVGKATTLVADAIVAEALPGVQNTLVDVTLLRFGATLTQTRTGAPITGERIDFYIGDSFVCSGVTDANGRATCAVPLSTDLAAVLNLGYTAKYDGSDALHLLSTTANGPIVRVLSIPILPV